jgi:hypothetical protein
MEGSFHGFSLEDIQKILERDEAELQNVNEAEWYYFSTDAFYVP